MWKAETRSMSTIMVVEDSDDLREVVAAILIGEGHRVLPAANGQEALDLLRSGEAPALIFLDLMMPVLSGAELLELIQEDRKLASYPVVVISAFADEGSAPGVKRFVRKPLSAAIVRELITTYAVG
jgi:CheY-like chemotaxis protein